MIKKPRQCFESNRMDRYLASSSRTSSEKINELWEEDLWPVDLKEADVEAVEDRKINNCMEGQFLIRSTGFHGSLWMIPRMGDSSSDAGLRQHHQSAPVNVPDWSKILGVDYLKAQNPFAMDVEMAGGDEEEEEKGDRVPPHEYLAREDARCRVFAKASILQGVGLKGREMSRIRNAVWSQTGFLG